MTAFDRGLAGRRIEGIVIGTSAGGVEALGIILPQLPATFAVPVFIVQHLPRDRRSHLVEIFSARCACRVQEAEDKEPVAGGTVYFAPPDYHLLLEAGPALALSADEPVHFSRPSIDVLFESAAEVYDERLMAIILTGASQDGAAGLDAVRRAGGCTVAQQPATAQAPLMIEEALKRGPVDFLLPLAEIGQLLGAVGNGVTGANESRP